jgi:hypothetical protein
MDDGLNGQPNDEAASMEEISSGAAFCELEMADLAIDALDAHAASAWNDAGMNDDVEVF